jgi:hypothetical protein
MSSVKRRCEEYNVERSKAVRTNLGCKENVVVDVDCGATFFLCEMAVNRLSRRHIFCLDHCTSGKSMQHATMEAE